MLDIKIWRRLSFYQTAKQLLTLCNHEYPSNVTNIICKINERIKDPCNKNVTLEILWVAGHAGIQGSDLADQCAKEALNAIQFHIRAPHSPSSAFSTTFSTTFSTAFGSTFNVSFCNWVIDYFWKISILFHKSTH